MADSDRNCNRMDPVLAPRDFRIPISLVRSVTDTKDDVHNADTTYQSREMAAMNTTKIVI